MGVWECGWVPGRVGGCPGGWVPGIPRRKFQASIDGLLEILKSWLTTSDNSSWNTLTDALKTMGEKQLAGSLERKYCLTKEMRDSKQLAVS